MAVKEGPEEENEALQEAEQAASGKAEDVARRLEALEAELGSRTAVEDQVSALARGDSLAHQAADAISKRPPIDVRHTCGSWHAAVAMNCIAASGRRGFRQSRTEGLFFALCAEDVRDDGGWVGLPVDEAVVPEGGGNDPCRKHPKADFEPDVRNRRSSGPWLPAPLRHGKCKATRLPRRRAGPS
jgi:hypothetical protein